MILRKAAVSELPPIWVILQQAIEQRRLEGSEQWQNGYPNEKVILEDIENGYAHVLVENNEIVAYAALIFGVEPAYNDIVGEWISNDDYLVVHRVATSNAMKGKGIATHLFKELEVLCIDNKVFSIKVDTNFDNIPMMKIFTKLNYTYCGEVFVNGASRRAYEKVLI